MTAGTTVTSVMEDKKGAIVISAILGMGLAALFARTCQGSDCVVVRAPPREQTEKHVYRIDDKCYRYTPYPVACTDGTVPSPAEEQSR